MTLPALIDVEARKLRGSLAGLLCLAAPSLVAVLIGFTALRSEPRTWFMTMMGACSIWGFFMLPMAVTALGVLTAQMEHGPRSWDHLLALPIPRWRLFTAKALVVLALTAAMSVLLLLETRTVGLVLQALAPHKAPLGRFDWPGMAARLSGVWAAALGVTMIQLWTSLRLRSFVPALALGVGGTFFAVAASGMKEGVYIPWMSPLNALATDPSRAATAVVTGAAVGIGALVLMVLHLERREW